MLAGKRIAVPESRQLDIMARLLENRGGTVIRIPMVAIHDAPDPEPVLSWIRGFIKAPPDELILLTGEGLRRLVSLAERHDLKEDLVATLASVPKLYRGPKPNRALGEVGLKGEIPALAPTTDGVIETLQALEIEGHRIGVQLYGTEPNRKLMDYLASRKVDALPVAPYVYADQAEEDRVVQLIHDLAGGALDVIAFTSQPQWRRLQQVARKASLEQELYQGLKRATVAAVGPVVRDQLVAAGVGVPIMPERTFFMKPLVSAIVKYFDVDNTEQTEGTAD